MRRFAAGLLLLVGSCAHPPPTVVEPAPSRPELFLPRSSLAAIIERPGDLELTDLQIERLRSRDDDLEREQAPLRASLERQHEEGASPSAPQPGMAMGGSGGRRHGQSRNNDAAPKPKGARLEEQLDDNDTRAYLAAEAAVLTDQQREPAREIAEKYREALYDQRDRASRVKGQ